MAFSALFTTDTGWSNTLPSTLGLKAVSRLLQGTHWLLLVIDSDILNIVKKIKTT
jgi:hypothetical protein